MKKSTTAIRRIAWNDDSSKPRFVTGDHSGIIYVWNVGDKTAAQFKFHKDEIKGLAWIDADTFASCSMDGKIKIGRIGFDNYLQKFRHSVNCCISLTLTGSLKYFGTTGISIRQRHPMVCGHSTTCGLFFGRFN